MSLSTIAVLFSGDNSAVAVYLLLILACLVAVFLILRNRPQDARRYLFAEVIYGTVAGALPFALAHDFFEIIQLLAYGCFLGGVAFLIICGCLARKKLKMMASMFFAIAWVVSVVGIDAFLLEPTALELTHFTIKNDKLSKPLKIAVAADLQTDNIGAYERGALKKIMDEKPDLILLAGDYLQVWSYDELNDQTKKLKQALKDTGFGAPLGVYAVMGNVEDASWPTLFSDLKGKCFEKTESIAVGEVTLTGLGFNDSFNDQLKIAPSRRMHIVFGHGPDFSLSRFDADLLIAGHTHGGQVQIPGIGPIFTFSKVPRAWAQGGLIQMDDGRTLIISRGIGLERHHAPRLRFLCRPQIVIVDVLPDKK
ncbi:MAG TPA: metallophosphoesterase [Candidatus Obscuribacterales bacterium]